MLSIRGAGPNVGLMLAQRLRRFANIKSTLGLHPCLWGVRQSAGSCFLLTVGEPRPWCVGG